MEILSFHSKSLWKKLFRGFFIVMLLIAAHKLIYATCGIHQLNLARVERVRGVGYFHLVHGIGFAVHFYRFFRLNGGPAQKHMIVGHILEGDQTIV